MQLKISWSNLHHLIILLVLFSAKVQGQDTISVISTAQDLNHFVSCWVDTSNKATIEDFVNGEISCEKKIDFSNAGILSHPIWLRYILTSQEELDKVIYLGNPDVRRVTFYIYDENLTLIKRTVTGRSAVSSDKDVISRYPAVRISFNEGQTVNLFVKIENRNYPMYFPLTMVNEKDFHELNTNEIMFESLFIGLMCMTLLIVIGIYYWLRKRQFIYYGLALFMIVVFYAAESGFFIGLDSPELFQDRVKYVSTSLLMVFMTLFIRQAVVFKSKAIILIKVIWGMNIFHMFFAISILFIPVQTSEWFIPVQMLYFLTVQLYGVVFLTALAWEATHKNKMAFYGFLAYFFFVVTSIVKVMVINGVMEFSWTIFSVLKLASLFEIGIFNFLIFVQIKAWYDERNKLLMEVNSHQQDLLNALVKGEERERKRLSEELHDSVGSMLSALKLNMPSIKSLKENISDKEKRRIEKGVNLLDNTLKEVRNLSHALQPPDLKNFGLEAELKQYVARMQTEDFKIHLRFDHWPQLADQQLSLALFRIVQEAISNTVKHAQAKNLSIHFIGEDDELSLTIEDDGKGFDMDVRNFGLGVKNMKSRIANFKATFQMESAPGHGTLIIIKVLGIEKIT